MSEYLDLTFFKLGDNELGNINYFDVWHYNLQNKVQVVF